MLDIGPKTGPHQALTHTRDEGGNTMANASLYERLGKNAGIGKLVDAIVDRHLANPRVHIRFAKYDPAELKRKATEFMCAGTGGPEQYTGKGLMKVHEHMNINGDEFMAVMDDVMKTLAELKVGEREQQEVITTFMTLKDEILYR